MYYLCLLFLIFTLNFLFLFHLFFLFTPFPLTSTLFDDFSSLGLCDTEGLWSIDDWWCTSSSVGGLPSRLFTSREHQPTLPQPSPTASSSSAAFFLFLFTSAPDFELYTCACSSDHFSFESCCRIFYFSSSIRLFIAS